jgi:hypothetical protein
MPSPIQILQPIMDAVIKQSYIIILTKQNRRMLEEFFQEVAPQFS